MTTHAAGRFSALHQLGERGRAIERARGPDPYPRPTGPPPSLEQLRAQRRQIEQLAERHGARRVRVFGSVARGQARPDSDLDLLIDLDGPHGLLDQAALQGDLEQLLDCRVQVLASSALHAAHDGARERIEHEALAL